MTLLYSFLKGLKNGDKDECFARIEKIIKQTV